MSKRLSFEYVKKFFEEQGCELMESSYKNNSIKMKYKCECGNISAINFNNFKNGNRCRKCSGYEKYIYKEVYNYFKEQHCVLLEVIYKNALASMKYKCKCGNISKINFNNFQNGKRCKKCGIKNRSGENNCNYNPNKTDEERELKRDYSEYYNWRKGIFKKDVYTCKCCFQIGGSLNAHHIRNYSNNRELRTDESNGITLCKICHLEFHKKYGKKDNNRQQLDEFLKVGSLCLK